MERLTELGLVVLVLLAISLNAWGWLGGSRLAFLVSNLVVMPAVAVGTFVVFSRQRRS